MSKNVIFWFIMVLQTTRRKTFSFYSNMNIGLVGNISIPNIHDLTNHSTGGANSELNLDNNTSSILVAVWIGLMILGSYLLFHIHFKVLPKE